jgi:hypothetical protein
VLLEGWRPEERPEGGACGAVESHVASSFELFGAQGATRLTGSDDALAEEDVARVHPGLHEEPGEEAHAGRRTAAPDPTHIY